MVGDHKIKLYAWVNTFIYLFQGAKAKIATKNKSQTNKNKTNSRSYCTETYNKTKHDKSLHGSITVEDKLL